VTFWLSLADIECGRWRSQILKWLAITWCPRPALLEVPFFEQPFAMATWADATDDTVHNAT
jgi:hypothetical protein